MGESAMSIAKSGWVWRQTSILRRWKKNWFVLRLNGDLNFFDSDSDYQPEDTVCIPVECSFFKQSYECEVDPPSGLPRESLFSIVTAERTIYCCAESSDDAQAWLFMLEQARMVRPTATVSNRGASRTPNRVYAVPPPNVPMSAPNPVYDGNRGEYYMPQRVIHHPDGRTTVVYGDRPYCHHHRGRCCSCYGSDASLGLVAGAATGALLFSPFLWWPFWF